MAKVTLVVRGQRVLLPTGVAPAAIHIADDRIAAITAFDAPKPDSLTLEAGELIVAPGIVDSHVHINEPGRTEWEGFHSATQAAAAGGITTVVDMPLNCIPATVNFEAAELKRASLRDQLFVDVAFWGGVIPGNTAALEGLQKFGVPGCKCFLCPSGVDEFPHVTRGDLEAAMPVLRELGRTLLVHAEAPEPLAKAEAAVAGSDPRSYSTYLRSRPAAAEDQAIAMIIELSEKHRCPAHIVHLSSGDSVAQLAAAQARGVPITAETCLHYLNFVAEEIGDGATGYKCAPPIRDRANREQLWAGLRDGTIGMVVSDHSPCTPQLKRLESGDFMSAWGGIAGLQLGLSVLWSRALERGFSLEKVFALNSTATARLAGLGQRKGALAVGFDADLVIWDDRAQFEVAQLKHRHALTPYAGQRLTGVVETTVVGGRVAYTRREGITSRPVGRFVAA